MIYTNSADNPCKAANEIQSQAINIINELIEKAGLCAGQLLVIGCSSSEIIGQNIGHGSSLEAAEAVFSAIYPIILKNGIELAVQCCEHLNRCLIVEEKTARRLNLPIVNAVPQPKAGGSFATTAYNAFEHPVAVESIGADAGLDIGLTLIGMHLKPVAIPLRLQNKTIGEAIVTAARTRPKFIGGIRAAYNENLL